MRTPETWTAHITWFNLYQIAGQTTLIYNEKRNREVLASGQEVGILTFREETFLGMKKLSDILIGSGVYRWWTFFKAHWTLHLNSVHLICKIHSLFNVKKSYWKAIMKHSKPLCCTLLSYLVVIHLKWEWELFAALCLVRSLYKRHLVNTKARCDCGGWLTPNWTFK